MAGRGRLLLGVVSVLTVAVATGSAGGATRTYSTGPLAHPIPDVGTAEVPLAVLDRGPVSYAEVAVRIDHPRDSDLTLSLVSPSGTEVVLSARRGGTGRNYGSGPGCRRTTLFVDDASTPVARAKPPFLDDLKPEQRLSTFDREEAAGRWKLRIADDRRGAAGTLRCFRLRLGRDVVQTETARARGTEAQLSFRETNDVFGAVHLRILRGGTVLYDAAPKRLHPCACPGDGPAGGQYGGALRVRDLDGDGEPEVLVDLYTGGAHCCFYTDVYRYRPRLRTYRPTVGFWGDLGVNVVDLGHDGRVEFRTADDRFAYVFTAFAASAFPIRILRFDHGRFADVTRRFPALVRHDAAQQYARYKAGLRSAFPDVRGVLAAWLADQYLLGHGRSAWGVVRRAVGRGEVDHAYLRKLRAFLRRTGYVRS